MAALARFRRREFIDQRWNYAPQEHVFFCAPTQAGKTDLAYELMGVTPSAKPPVSLVMKPRDPTPAKMTKRLGWKEIREWPPPRRFPWQGDVPGYTLWPRHQLSLDPASIERTNKLIKAQFERCLMGAYQRGDQVVFADEVWGLLADLDMGQVVNNLLTRGGGMKAPLWYATQKPGGVVGAPLPGYVFNSPTHLFLGYDPVGSNRKRFADIGGVNTALVMDTVSNLQTHPIETPGGTAYVSEFLYINKNGPRGGYMAIIEPF
jgi:hypothetical protein